MRFLWEEAAACERTLDCLISLSLVLKGFAGSSGMKMNPAEASEGACDMMTHRRCRRIWLGTPSLTIHLRRRLEQVEMHLPYQLSRASTSKKESSLSRCEVWNCFDAGLE